MEAIQVYHLVYTCKAYTVYNTQLTVSSSFGYVDTRSGDTIEFVLILNTPDIALDRRFAPVWLQLGQVLDTFPAGPDAVTLGPTSGSS